MALSDPYVTLGVSKASTQDEIKAAYRNFAKKFHPDLNPGNSVAEGKFKDAAAAYELIGTAESRAQFDRGETPEQQQEQARRYSEQHSEQHSEQQGRSGAGGSGPYYHETQSGGGRYSSGFGSGMGSDDFFENLFRSASQGRGQGAQRRAPADDPGEDQLYQMSVDFRDAVLGAEREISLPTGKKLKIKIPPGVESGSKLRFKGQGSPGIGSGPAGDAYVEISVRTLNGFTRVGKNLESELPVTFIEALLGAEIKFPTIDGSVMLKVPSGVTTGSRLRVQGKGVLMSPEPGDQIFVLKVVMPKGEQPELREAVRSWGEKYAYNPREEK